MVTPLTPQAPPFSGNPWAGSATVPLAGGGVISDPWLDPKIKLGDPRLWLDKKYRALTHPSNPLRTKQHK